jgi:hypothetical protein
MDPVRRVFHDLNTGVMTHLNECHDESGRFCSEGGGGSSPGIKMIISEEMGLAYDDQTGARFGDGFAVKDGKVYVQGTRGAQWDGKSPLYVADGGFLVFEPEITEEGEEEDLEKNRRIDAKDIVRVPRGVDLDSWAKDNLGGRKGK